ncbi:hypothetical protein MIZ01_0861 [Sideroxyarcus emersonii]|uniref:Uncharacterized protein n=1 Tax=Sideroxyarcus emersonii TaxID=2764705 RepID=A0AAN1X9B1_9PROT|nr:hypothetical protein [Sideroxyarcus emersonii]BCK87091.1 hypothetical protein MIZ01_0861 [Sideroxyarcus emersonii]
MVEARVPPFVVSGCLHRALGPLVKVEFADGLVLRFTPVEASSLSFALAAVRCGISPEREIYLSPIASDAAFVGAVRDGGIGIAVRTGTLELDWPGAGRLADALAAAIGQG